jgi:hypothetical protein
MRKIEYVERQIDEDSREEFAELGDWVLERDWASPDVQIEADTRSGNLDKLLKEAEANFKAQNRRLTIGGVRERWVVTRRERGKPLCARGGYRALLGGPSTSPLDRSAGRGTYSATP